MNYQLSKGDRFSGIFYLVVLIVADCVIIAPQMQIISDLIYIFAVFIAKHLHI